MKTCKSGSEGVSVKPDVEIHEGARLLPYKGTWVGSGVPPSPIADKHPPANRQDLTHLMVRK